MSAAATVSSAATRRQLARDELLHLRWLLGGALSLLALLTVVYMDVDAWITMALAAAATLATMLRPQLPGRVPRVAHTLAFPAIVAFFAGDLWLSGELLPAMVRLDILLLLYRNLSYRQRRDDLQIVVLGLFLVIVAGVLTVSLTFAAHLLVYTSCALALLLTLTLTENGEKTPNSKRQTAPEQWVPHADLPRLLRRLREAADWRVVGLGAVLFVGVVAISALLFLAIPRFQLENNMFLDRFIAKKSKTGFSDSISFGDVTEIQQDTSVALSVDVSDQSAVPSSPYWRMLVLDYYVDGTFKLSPGLRGWEFRRERSAAALEGTAQPKEEGPAAVWTFFLESGVSRYMPQIGPFARLRFRETQNVHFAPQLSVVMLRDEPASMTAYQVEGYEAGSFLRDANFAQRWKARNRDDAAQRLGTLQFALRLHGADRLRVERLAAEITGGKALPAGEFARRAGAWLRQQHSYSLSSTVPKGEGDPLVRWMTSREPGHCELFAGSLVVLARAAGYPARVVTGFRGGTWNGYSNNFTIRNSDAHAWTEIFDEEAGGWLRADPLQPEESEQSTATVGETAVAARLDRSWRARLDSLRVFWYRRIVSFDQQSQLETLKAVKTATQETSKELRAWLTARVDAMKAWLLSPWDVRRVATVAGAAAAAAALWWSWRQHGRGWWRRAVQRSGGRHGDPVRREAGRWLRRIDDNETPVADAGLRTALQRLRYGARPTWDEPETIFRRAQRACREARKQRATRS